MSQSVSEVQEQALVVAKEPEPVEKAPDADKVSSASPPKETVEEIAKDGVASQAEGKSQTEKAKDEPEPASDKKEKASQPAPPDTVEEAPETAKSEAKEASQTADTKPAETEATA
jgi:hypothetical protein